MGDYIAKSKAHRAKRDASIPASYLADLSAAGVGLCGREAAAAVQQEQAAHAGADYDLPDGQCHGVPGKVLSLEDVAITETPIDKLLDLLRTGKLPRFAPPRPSCVGQCWRTNSPTAARTSFVDRALARAKECDDTLASTGKPIGLLHGLPVSLKDQFDIKDTEMTMGYVGWIGRVAKSNSVITDVILRAGGVPYVRTSIPQSLMRCETHNHIYGRTSARSTAASRPRKAAVARAHSSACTAAHSAWARTLEGRCVCLRRSTGCGACVHRCIVRPMNEAATAFSAGERQFCHRDRSHTRSRAS